MRIGILTFHCAHNYGAVLQCYALQEYLLSLGHEVTVIDYRPDYLTRPYRLFNRSHFSVRKPLKFAKQVFEELVYYLPRWLVFENFIRRRLHLSKRIKDKSIPEDYDIYVYGSDQIWNPNLTNGGDDIYLASIKKTHKRIKCFAYAASIGVNQLSAPQQEFFRTNLNSFNKISVREYCDIDKFRFCPQEIVQVIDPTLLIEESFWTKLSSPNSKVKDYVLVYGVRPDDSLFIIANTLAKQLHAKVLTISAWGFSEQGDINLRKESPESFLTLIRNASCVVTSSFHGLSFSIIFRVPFYSIRLGDEGDGRSKSLLETLGLGSRLIEKDATPTFSLPDYSITDQILKQEKIKSKQYIDSWFE